MKLIDDWKAEIHRLWTVRLALFMFVLTGASAALPAVQDKLNPHFFFFVSTLAWALVGYLRLVKQVPKAEL